MVNFCAVFNCTNKASKNSDGCKSGFYRIPNINPKAGPDLQELQKKRREKWISALKRKDISEDKIQQFRICSNHFIAGNMN